MPEQHAFKVVVAGPFASGKSTLIRAISESPVVGTEQPTSGLEAGTKPTTTVGMEYGTYSIVDEEIVVDLSMYGVPGQPRFSFMWDIVAEGMDGLLLLVDAAAPATWPEAVAVGLHFQAKARPPIVIGVNRTHGDDGAMAAVRAATAQLDAHHVTCEVIDPASARDALVSLLLLVLEQLDEPDPEDEMQMLGAT